ncbi:MAG: hypothetical protein NZM35_06945 [Chitinophagales bacterium]|nr:hypothetical protein [Chitinophagales bacterium]MDW8419091.1 hypothetical protein [Chitinophagales bacterium]
MLRNILIYSSALVTLLFCSSCQKDLSKNWGGTYTGIAGSNTVQRVIVTILDKKTVKMELQAYIAGNYYTYVTLSKVKLTNEKTAVIDEEGTITTVPPNNTIYKFSGAASLSGNTLTINGSATDKNNSSSVTNYTFTGSK